MQLSEITCAIWARTNQQSCHNKRTRGERAKYITRERERERK